MLLVLSSLPFSSFFLNFLFGGLSVELWGLGIALFGFSSDCIKKLWKWWSYVFHRQVAGVLRDYRGLAGSADIA